MEKRYFLAIALSFFVIFGWSLIQGPKAVLDTDTFQNVDIKENKAVQAGAELLPSDFLVNKTNDTEIIAEIKKEAVKKVSILENDEVYLEFSNVGGVLVKAVLKNFDYTFPISSISGYAETKSAHFELLHESQSKITYGLQLGDEIVTKTYDLDERENILHNQITIENTSNMSKQKSITIDGIQLDMSSLDKNSGNWSRDKMLFEYVVSYGSKDIYRHKNAFKFSDKDNKVKNESVNWVGFRDRYFSLIVDPKHEVEKYETTRISDEILNVSYSQKSVTILPKNKLVLSSEIIIAPQEIDVLKGFDQGYEKIVNYGIGGFFDIFAFGLGDPSAKILLGILKFVHNIVHSWGIAIVVVALLVCGGTYPLTLKSMKSMQRMQQVQPELAKIKEKHEKNPQKMQQETMEFYKKNKINPFGGCLPMFLQMPIFFGVIQLLWRYVGLRGEGFLWIKDLSEPDRLFLLPISIPIIGNEINILPIIVFGLTILQQRFSGKHMVTTDSNQAMQMKMMKFMLPSLIILFFYKFASAMALYFTIFYMFSTYTQWKMAKERGMNRG